MITHHIFGDESGAFHSEPYFVLGLIKTMDPARLQAQLDAICMHHSVSCEIKYSSTNRLTLPARIDFVDAFFASNDADFRCIVKDRSCYDPNYFKNNHLGIPARDMAYNHTYAKLLRFNLETGERALVFVDDKTRTKKDNLFEYLRSNVPCVADAQPRDSKSTRLLQLADLLTGCVFGDLVGTNQPVKRAVQAHLLGKLGRPDFRSKINGDKFNLWHWRAK